MLNLVNKKIIKVSKDIMPYAYYVNTTEKNILENIKLNWVRIWLDRRTSWNKVIDFDYENFRAEVKNNITGEQKQYHFCFEKIRWFDKNVILIDSNLIERIRRELYA